MLRTIDAIPPEALTILVRSSLNVPILSGVVQNEFRVRSALETLVRLSATGARVIIISHRNGEGVPSMRPVYEALRTRLDVSFVEDCIGPAARSAIGALRAGDILMLENIRRNKGEETNDASFSRELASLADVYVNDDFAASHRVHASIVSLPRLLPGFAGVQFMREIEGLSRARAPVSPSLAIIGGAKFLTKEPAIRALLTKYNHVFVGGALANDFFRARGIAVGRSLVSNATIDSTLLHNPRVLLPTDVTVERHGERIYCAHTEVEPSDIICDIGPTSLNALIERARHAQTVVWNGPLGNFEKGYSEMTESLARALATYPGTSIVGGGDTLAAIEKLNVHDKFEFLSTAGGAMLDFLTHGTLPGIEALKHSKRF